MTDSHHHHKSHDSRHADGRPYDRHMHDADWQEVWERQRGREPMERGWLDALALRPGSRLVDVGSGPGYISILAAEQVGTDGRVYAVDQSADALAFLRQQLAGRPSTSVEPLAGSATAIPLPDASADRALVAQMLHHNEAPRAILFEVLRVLAPGGLLLVVEHDPDGSEESGPPRSERLPADTVRTWLIEAGFADVADRAVGDGRYGFLARKPTAT
jgi:ubiquinone/menaquinone biosynthesis C-methylase UbiE